MAKNYFKTECPRCGNTDEICCESHNAPPEVKCGECLMNDVEVVAPKVTPLRRELARNELAMKGVYVRDIKSPRSDYEWDDRESDLMLEMLKERKKRKAARERYIT